jgi:hypothetical protein
MAGMRPFYSFVLSHVVASYVMLTATYLLERERVLPHRPDAQDVMVLVLSPLYSWYMLAEPVARFPQWRLHTAIVWGSYLAAFFATYYLVRWRGFWRARRRRDAALE